MNNHTSSPILFGEDRTLRKWGSSLSPKNKTLHALKSRAIIPIGAHLFACLLLFSPKALFSQAVVPLIRNYAPPAWQAADVKWIRDVQPHNKIDDFIDTASDDRFDVVVNFKRCVEDRDITMLNHWSPTNRVQRRLKYISSVAVGSLSKPEICAIAASPDVAFIEQQFGFSQTLNLSVPNICVTAGSPSCPGNVAALGFTGTGVNIAIIDTGVDDAHSAFAGGAYQFGYNATVSPTVFANPPDDIFHGTHVASIALGRSWVSGGITYRGVAPGAGLIDVKVIDADDFCGSAIAWGQIVDGLQTVYDQRVAWNVRVINMSLRNCNADGSPVPSDGLDSFSQLVDLAEAMGIVVVAAAANDGPANTALATPAAATRAITVAASETMNTASRADDGIACFSSRGPRDDDGDADAIDELKPEVAAPGTHNDNCVLGGTGIQAALFNTASGVFRSEGTSMAAPHVAGLAALIMEAQPGINAASVRDLIISTATPIGPPSLPLVDPVWNNAAGWGLVNGFQAVSVAGGLTDLSYPSHPPDPIWLSPDIRTVPYPPIVGAPATVYVKIRNFGPVAATGVRVHFGVHVYSIATPTFYDIGTVVDSFPYDAGSVANSTKEVSVTWVPQNAGHQCLKVEIGYGPDTDYSNNNAQRNITVQNSPVTFLVQNTLTETPAPIRLVATLGGNTQGETNWTFRLETNSVTLGANDCPVPVRVELIPGANVPPGEKQILHIRAVINRPTGPVTLGGVSIEAVKPYPVINVGGSYSGTINGAPVNATSTGQFGPKGDETNCVFTHFSNIPTGFHPSALGFSWVSFICHNAARTPNDGVIHNLFDLTGGNYTVQRTFTWPQLPGNIIRATGRVSTVGPNMEYSIALNGSYLGPTNLVNVTDYSVRWRQQGRNLLEDGSARIHRSDGSSFQVNFEGVYTGLVANLLTEQRGTATATVLNYFPDNRLYNVCWKAEQRDAMRLQITLCYTNAVVTWTTRNAVLQGASDVTGPWSDIIGATSPHFVPAVEPRRFYRLRAP